MVSGFGGYFYVSETVPFQLEAPLILNFVQNEKQKFWRYSFSR